MPLPPSPRDMHISPSSNKGLGRIHVPDPGDANYHATTKAPHLFGALPPQSTHYTFRLPHNVNQGQLPYCVGAAWRHWLYCSPMQTTLGPTYDQIYREAQELDGLPDTLPGTTVRAGAEALRSRGHIAQYWWLNTVDEIRLWVLRRETSIVMGTNWYQSFSEFQGARMRLAGPLEGGHAWIIIGWSDQLEAARMQNSWGLRYGEKGRKWVPAPILARLLSEDGEACVAIEKRVGAEARNQAEVFHTLRAAKTRDSTKDLIASIPQFNG